MKNFRTFEIAVSFYHLATSLPVKRPLKDQLHRAALSIPLNLAEGRGKPTMADQKRFFHIAMGSVRECQALLIIGNLQATDAWTTLDSLAAHLYRLIENTR